MMTIECNIEEIESLIAKGKTEMALILAKDYLRHKDQSLYQECLILSNKYYEQKQDFILDLCKEKEASGKIVLGLLNILRRADKKGLFIKQASQQSNVTREETNLELVEGFKFATKTERLLANIAENLIAFLAIIILYISLGLTIDDLFHDMLNGKPSIEALFATSIFIGLFRMLFYPVFSGNLGHIIFGLKVIDTKTGKNISSFKSGFIREFLKAAGSHFIIPNIWILFHKENRNLYDILLHTAVVKK